MRNVHAIILSGLLIASNANGQEKIVNTISTIQLPKGSKLTESDRFESFGKEKFKRNIKPSENSNSYIVDNSLMVSIRELRVSSLTGKSLEKWKSQLEVTYQVTGGTLDVSKTDTVNGNRFYFFEDHEDDEYIIFFYSEDIEDRKLIGFIAYKAKKRKKAFKYLHHLLRDIKLKK